VENQDHWCFTWMAGEEEGTGATRAALLRGVKWNPGEIISVSFLDGDPAVQKKVRNVARRWTYSGRARLRLDFRQGPDTDIRISFRHPGSWSVLGTTCRQVTDKSRPTMNYGWLHAGSTAEEIRRVVLHEFGHALGLVHEHQNPADGIKWNREAAINELSGSPNNWSLATIEFNMFHTFSDQETNFTALDPRSIMMYPIPERWTTNGFSVGLNSNLSKKDKEFISQQYP
jgi:serralysin